VTAPRLAISIKTFLRNDCLFECVQAIRTHVDLPYRIYVADDGPVDEQKRALYESLRDEGHFVLELPYDVGASAGRNALLEHIDEELVLRLDDDFIVTEETDLRAMAEILLGVEDLGALSDLERERHGEKGVAAGQISLGQGDLEIRGRSLIRTLYDLDALEYERFGPYRFQRAGFTRNFLLIKREMLEEIRWNERLKIHGEHVDFMLRIQRHPRWDLAFTPDSIHLHAGPPASVLAEEYRLKRHGRDEKWGVLADEWGIRSISTRGGAARPLRTRVRGLLRRLGLRLGRPRRGQPARRNRAEGSRRA
jgi:GT2 family glycosyltransferase